MIKRALIVSAVLVLSAGGGALADQEPAKSPEPNDDAAAVCTAMMSSQGVTAKGTAQMRDSMRSEKMGRGMGQMIEMMASMGGTMGSDMMGRSAPPDQAPE